MTLSDFRKLTIKKLMLVTQTPQLDSELLFMHALQLSRAELIIRSENILSKTEIAQINALIERRIKGEPIAYLLESQPFWTLDLTVTSDTLIPRPETECLVDWIISHIKNRDNCDIADLGTGTGAIALALGVENKTWRIDSTDISFEALAIAKKNADAHGIKNVSFFQGDWCDALPRHKKYDVIVSNPPYIAENDPHLEKLTYEPVSALVSGKTGLDDIKKIVSSCHAFLKPSGFLVIEHGFDQAQDVEAIFKKSGFTNVQNHRDLADIPRFVTGCL